MGVEYLFLVSVPESCQENTDESGRKDGLVFHLTEYLDKLEKVMCFLFKPIKLHLLNTDLIQDSFLLANLFPYSLLTDTLCDFRAIVPESDKVLFAGEGQNLDLSGVRCFRQNVIECSHYLRSWILEDLIQIGKRDEAVLNREMRAQACYLEYYISASHALRVDDPV